MVALKFFLLMTISQIGNRNSNAKNRAKSPLIHFRNNQITVKVLKKTPTKNPPVKKLVVVMKAQNVKSVLRNFTKWPT